MLCNIKIEFGGSLLDLTLKRNFVKRSISITYPSFFFLHDSCQANLKQDASREIIYLFICLLIFTSTWLAIIEFYRQKLMRPS